MMTNVVPVAHAQSTLTAPTISVSLATIALGQTAELWTTIPFANGTSLYTCQWLEEPPASTSFSNLDSSFTTGCTPSSRPFVSTRPLTMAGTWSFELQVKDATGTVVVSSPVSLTVSSRPGAAVTLTCNHASVVVGSKVTCKATVQGVNSVPTGTVTWSTNSTGTFSKTSCKLSKGACSVKFTPTAARSSVVLTANYGGDSKNFPSLGEYSLAVTMKSTKTTVSCTPKSAVAGSSTVITCKAKVTGYSPTGEVSWSQSGTGSVAINSATCILTKGTCSLTMIGATAGKVTLQATYSGDFNNQVSSRTAKLTVSGAVRHCHSVGGLPDPSCTPGATDPRVNQSDIMTTICVPGYTATVRPSTSYTNPLKNESIRDYGYYDTNMSDYEEDHLIPLEIGGSPTSVSNLWAEPHYGNYTSYDKDGFENYLHAMVCDGSMSLVQAQKEIATNWVLYWIQAERPTGSAAAGD